MIARSTLYAPIDGVVSMIRVKEGEMARPGTAVARVFDPKDLWLRFAVERSEDDAVSLQTGTRVRARLAGSGQVVSAIVRNVSTDLEPPLQFIVADADIDDAAVSSESIQVGVVGRVSLLDPSSVR